MRPDETLEVGRRVTPKQGGYHAPILYVQRFERLEDRTLVALGPDDPEGWRARSAFDESEIETTHLIPLKILVDEWKDPEDPTRRHEVCKCGHDGDDHTGMGVGCLKCDCKLLVVDHHEDRLPTPAAAQS